MNYLGGKGRLVDWVEENILCRTRSRTRYVEPFVGSGAVWMRVAHQFKEAHGSDLMPDVVMFLNALRGGWTPPTQLTDTEREELRYSNKPSALRGFVGFCCGFRGKFFLCNVWPEDSVRELAMRELRRAKFFKRCPPLAVMDYQDVEIRKGDVVYCDPPYANTTAYTWVGAFDSYGFWAKMISWVEKGAFVLISEEDAPRDWAIVAELGRRRTTSYDPKTGKNGANSYAVEKIYMHETQVDDRMTLAKHQKLVLEGMRPWPAVR